MRQFLKYEFKNNWKAFVLTYLIVITSFFILSVFILLNKLNIDYSTLIALIYTNILLLVGGSMILGVILFSINLVKSFYNSIYSDEGYLTLSFPRSCHELFLSKIISNLVWILGLVVSIVIGTILTSLSGDGSVSSMFESLFELLHIFAIDYLPALPFQIMNILTSIILSYVLLLLSFTLVNLGGTRKGKMILGLVIFMGFTYALVVLNMFTRYLSCGLAVNYDGNLVFAFGAIETDLFASFGCVTYAFNITKFMINLSLAIGLYILNAYLFAKKLDIE